MNVFELRQGLVTPYAAYIRSFIQILDSELLWPEPLLPLNPSFEPGRWIDELADEGILHEGLRIRREAIEGTLTPPGQRPG
jgi:hypothetical protein